MLGLRDVRSVRRCGKKGTVYVCMGEIRWEGFLEEEVWRDLLYNFLVILFT